MNKHDIGGIIKSDVVLKSTTKNNTPVLNLLIVTKDTFKNKGGETIVQNNPHNVKFWSKTAEMVAKNYKKGDYIIVSGRSETKQVGEKHVTELIVSKVEHIK